MKFFAMAFFMFSVAVGNLFTGAVIFSIQNDDGASKLADADYYWFFTLLMLSTALVFTIVSRFYPEKPIFTMKLLHQIQRNSIGTKIVFDRPKHKL